MKNVMIVIETPAGRKEKYNYDPVSGSFFLKKILPSGMQFPYDFGCIPGTKGEDGDPLDAIIISECITFPGCMMECRIIGCLQAEQHDIGSKKKIKNDRFVAVPIVSEMYKHLKKITDVPAKVLRQLQHFFINYSKEENRILKITAASNASTAMKLISKSGWEYKAQQPAKGINKK